MKLPERAIVKVSACGIFSQPTFKSEMVNQALMWEEVLISDKKDNWCKIQLEYDGYAGWINAMYLTFSKKAFEIKRDYPTIMAVQTIKNIERPFGVSNLAANFILSPGTEIPLINEDYKEEYNSIKSNVEFFIFDIYDGSPVKRKCYFSQRSYPFISHNGCKPNELIHNLREFCIMLENNYDFLGFPYLWGGRSFQGYDCSGFIQAIFKIFCNLKFPRDAKDQINSELLEEVQEPYDVNAVLGDLFFFKTGDILNSCTVGYATL